MLTSNVFKFNYSRILILILLRMFLILSIDKFNAEYIKYQFHHLVQPFKPDSRQYIEFFA